jgi:hypothetical protein
VRASFGLLTLLPGSGEALRLLGAEPARAASLAGIAIASLLGCVSVSMLALDKENVAVDESVEDRPATAKSTFPSLSVRDIAATVTLYFCNACP